MSTIDVRRLRTIRVSDPGAVLTAAAERTQRPLGERLMLIAADHPARGSLGVRGEPMAMADREQLLDRLVTALAVPGVDGVLGTADILEDLLLLGALADKVVIGSMNRGGLQGAAFELDDRFTAYDAASLAAMGFDGGKVLTRIALADHATAATLESTAQAVNDLAAHELMAVVEPFMSDVVEGRLVNDLSTEAVQRSVAIATGLGATSRHVWLKLPVVDGMDRVAASTTQPILLLGGDPKGPPEETYQRWEQALQHDGVRGLIVGRALLYPPDGDVRSAVSRAASMVHGDLARAGAST